MTGGYKLPERKKYRVTMDLTVDELCVLRLALSEFLHAKGHPPYYYDWNKHILQMTDAIWEEAYNDPEL